MLLARAFKVIPLKQLWIPNYGLESHAYKIGNSYIAVSSNLMKQNDYLYVQIRRSWDPINNNWLSTVSH